MTPRPHAVRIGVFAIGGITLLILAVALLVGGRLFADTERALLSFPGSVQGLQVGAPVVMRGVRLGSVKSIQLVSEGRDFSVPVVVEIDLAQIRQAGVGADSDAALSVPMLVQRGLTARLATQSLLTGQQYVDLDLRDEPGPAVTTASAAAPGQGLPRIPTRPATAQALQALQEQLGKIDIAGLIDDARLTLGAARGLVSGPEIRSTLSDLSSASAALARLSNTLTQRAPRLADRAETALSNAGQAAGQVGTAADRFGGAAGRADALLASDSPTLVSLRKAADELASSAAALRQSSSGDSPTVQQLQQSLSDVGRAARAVRQLAELLDQQPEVLIRGREGSK